jgi:TPR repeat protein
MEHNVYEGSAPYIFISYAHRDRTTVLPIIQDLQKLNFRVWFDGGIRVGTKWADEIHRHIAFCKCIVIFISKASLASPHCYEEILEASQQNKILIPIHLEDVTIPENIQELIGHWQALYRNRYPSIEELLQELTAGESIMACRGKDYSAEEMVDQHVAMAVKYFRQAALDDDEVNSKFEIGDCYEQGAGVDRDKISAYGWYLWAAKHNEGQPDRDRPYDQSGIISAKLRLAKFYRRGTINWDEKAAAALYLEAAENWNHEGRINYAQCCQHGIGVEKDMEQAIRWYRLAAVGGNPEAQFLLGCIYLEPDNFDPQKAAGWLKLASKSSTGVAASADMMLRTCDLIPEDTPVAWKQALEYWDKYQACYDVGQDAQALEYLQEAAQLGHAEAQCELGTRLYFGQGFPRDPHKAVSWFLRSANQGYGGAALNLGNCYLNGEGVHFDDEAFNNRQAIKWYLEAAHHGHTGAQLQLAQCYCDGIGVEESCNAAIAWALYSLRGQGEVAAAFLHSLGVEV